MSVEEPSK